MSETKYPLCARAGLNIYSRDAVGSYNTERAKEIIPASDVEKLLAGATTVWLKENKRGSTRDYVPYQLTANPGLQSHYTHTARLLLVEPIVKDKAEGLLREFEKIFATSTLGRGEHILERRISINDEGKAWDLLDRARRLLEGE